MGWTSAQVGQLGNTTALWTVGPNWDGMSDHDIIVTDHDTGNSFIRKLWQQQSGEIYQIAIEVIGEETVIFKFKAENIE